MFKLAAQPTFEADVVIPGPAGDVGTLKITFRHKGKKELLTLIKSLEATPPRPDIDVLSDIIVGWSNCDAEFSRDNLELMLDTFPASTIAIFTAYQTALIEGRRKN